tara:strand:+ start:30884 stop:31327 length:444 start_codon:yes stop_codon:yes gene_type:complete
MNKCTLSFEFDAADSAQTELVVNFIRNLSHQRQQQSVRVDTKAEAKTPVNEVENKNDEEAKAVLSKAIQQDKKNLAKVSNDIEISSGEISSGESTVTIKELRKKLSEKVQDHRTVLIKKLNDLGAKRVTDLSVNHYHTFMEFMENLS